jgi:hypothetical protein
MVWYGQDVYNGKFCKMKFKDAAQMHQPLCFGTSAIPSQPRMLVALIPGTHPCTSHRGIACPSSTCRSQQVVLGW